MSYAVLNDAGGNLVDVLVDRVEVDDESLGVRLVDDKLGLRVFIPLSGSAPLLFEHERRNPHPRDSQISIVDVMHQMRASRA